MATYRTLPGRSRNSMIPQVTLPSTDDVIHKFEKEVAKHFKLLETDQVDMRFEDSLVATGILWALQAFPKPAKAYQLKLTLGSHGPEPIEVEPRDINIFRVTRTKKISPAVPPPLRKR